MDNINVRDLILATAPTANEPAPKAPAKPRKKPAGPTWEVVLSDFCDGAIRRKTSKTSRLLVLLMSQGQFYIKDEKTDEVEQLDADNLAKFFAGINERLTPVPWCSPFDSSRQHAERFCTAIDNENFQWLARHGYYRLAYDAGKWNWPSNYTFRDVRKQYDNPMNKQIQKVVEELLGKELTARLSGDYEGATEMERKAHYLLSHTNRNMVELDFFNEKFGLDWTRAYLRAFLAAPFVGSTLPQISYYGNGLFETTNFETGRFIEYLLSESVQMGYGTVPNVRNRYGSDLDDFIRTWRDCLRMQKQLRHKVYDKYPTDLDSMHRKLSFKVRIMEQIINEEGFKLHSERLSKLTKQDAYYLIRPPFNKEDMADEAAQQANCLASYIEPYAKDETDIFFMRTSLDPDKSLVTVEVRNGAIRQAYRACNRRPSDEELEWLAKWAAENSIEMVDADSQRPRAA